MGYNKQAINIYFINEIQVLPSVESTRKNENSVGLLEYENFHE